MAVKWPDIYLEFHRAHPTITVEGTIRLVMDLEAERDRLTRERDDVLGELASATDLANSWARESSVAEAQTPNELRSLIDRLWSGLSAKVNRLTRELAEYVTHAEGKYAEVWAERNGWQARAEIAERGLAEAQRYATELCTSMAKAWPAVPEWRPLPGIAGLLSQIDNMWVGYRDRLAALDAARQKEQGNG